MLDLGNLWNFILSIWNFILILFENAVKLWTAKIEPGIIGSIFFDELYFYEIAGVGLVVCITGLLLKKIIPDIF